MSTELALSTDNFDALAQAMGMSQDAKSGGSSLPRLRVWNSPVMGEVEVKGKKKKMEIVEAPTYRLEQADGSFVYAKQANVRVFMQRFMLKKYDAKTKTYVKTVMSDNLNQDLKDSAGGLNCGKPSGYIADFKSLPTEVQDLIKSIRRVRAVFGEVTLVDAVDDQGNEVEVAPTPFIFEVENRDSFKNMAAPIALMAKARKLPLQHTIELTLQEETTAKGDVFGIVLPEVNMRDEHPITEGDKEAFKDFTDWVANYNNYIVREYETNHSDELSDDDIELVGDFVDVNDDDVEVVED